MRILQISDTHLGARLNARGPVGWCRADDHHAALERALEPVFHDAVDLVVHAGDVFDRSRPPSRDVERAGALFRRVAARVPVLGIAGNHDRRGIQRWLPHAALSFHDRPTVREVGGLRIGLLPFKRRADDFAAARSRMGTVDLLVCHQGFHGSRVPGFTFRVGHPAETIGAEHLAPDDRFVAAGHLHPRQVVELGHATVIHGGSTERTSFTEADQPKGSVLWTFGRTVTWRFVDHATRSMGAVAPGALVRCCEDDVASVRARGAFAVVGRAGGRRRPVGGRRPVESGQQVLFP